MKTKVNKIAKIIAFGIFFMALFLNIKVTLKDPYLRLSNEVFAQSSSSSSGKPRTCLSECRQDPIGVCTFETVDHNGTPIIASCPHFTRN